MLNLNPQPIFLDLGVVKIYYYGLIMVIAILTGLFLIEKLAQQRKIDLKKIRDLSFYLILGGIIGARLYEVFFFNWHYYQENLLAIFKIWQGGLAIQGAIFSGIIILYFYCRYYRLNFFKYSDLFSIVIILGQAIGRWGNFFNQELYGPVSNLPWAIYIQKTGFYHHPNFFYESILNLILFFILLILFKRKAGNGIITLGYLAGYGLIRFGMEFIRIDYAPQIIGIRLPQLVSLILFLCSFLLIVFKKNIKIKVFED